MLLAIDGVRSEDVLGLPKDAQAQLPELRAMQQTGMVWGTKERPFAASGPNFISLPGYTEMLSGTAQTGCLDNDCQATKRPTLLDDFDARFPGEPSAVISSWSKLGIAASHHPSPQGSCRRAIRTSWGRFCWDRAHARS